MTQSPNQLLYNLYNIIALTEIKGYAMLQFSYMMLKIYDKVKLSPLDNRQENCHYREISRLRAREHVKTLRSRP